MDYIHLCKEREKEKGSAALLENLYRKVSCRLHSHVWCCPVLVAFDLSCKKKKSNPFWYMCKEPVCFGFTVTNFHSDKFLNTLIPCTSFDMQLYVCNFSVGKHKGALLIIIVADGGVFMDLFSWDDTLQLTGYYNPITNLQIFYTAVFLALYFTSW